MSLLPYKQKKIYYPEIDSLRFFAFLIVYLGHSRIPVVAPFFQVAWYGVEFFFLISGFLLTRILYKEFKKNTSISIKFYFLRRVLRIWPLYFSFLLIILLAAFVFQTPFSVERWLGNVFFIDNFFTAAGWINRNANTSHLWTISVEEQYYFVLPFLALFLFKKTTSQIITFFIIAFSLLFLGKLMAILLNAPYPFIHILPVSADSFLMGALVGLLFNDQSVSLRKNLLLFGTGIILLLAGLFLPNKNIIGFHLLLIYPLQATGFALLLISVLTGQQYPLYQLLGNKVLVYLGKISFGLYIFHIPVINRLTHLFNNKTVPGQVLGLVVMLLVTAVIAIISYNFLEKPFLSFKKKFQVVPSGELTTKM
jgi:peptidoglycan/LPS O-acetylase OafA/YrhL